MSMFIDRISSEGEVTSLVERWDIGIININYMIGDERRFMTLKLDGEAINDITPENNKGHYVHQVTSKYMLDVIIL